MVHEESSALMLVLEARSMAPRDGPSVLVSLHSTQDASAPASGQITTLWMGYCGADCTVCIQQANYKGLQEFFLSLPSSVAAHYESFIKLFI